jgi:hypothetical protein
LWHAAAHPFRRTRVTREAGGTEVPPDTDCSDTPKGERPGPKKGGSGAQPIEGEKMKPCTLIIAALAGGIAAFGPSPLRAQGAPAPAESDGVRALRNIASQSRCAAHDWPFRRGKAPRSYIEGVTLVFARAVCQPHRSDVQVVSAPVDTSPHSDDALAIYQAIFQAAEMRNDAAGVDTLRHSYALLIGLGMMESSGKYCEGRDVSQCFTTADSAEAGLFQTSFGARRFSPALEELFQRYSADQSGCLLEVFKGSITCKIVKSNNRECPSVTSDVAGTGPGADWQRLTKSCPAFATEYGAVVLRKHGGARGEFNPIRKRQAELFPECDIMLRKAQSFVEQHPEVCAAL